VASPGGLPPTANEYDGPSAADGQIKLSHVNEQGAANMVDITGKQPSERRAVARRQRHLAIEREAGRIFAEARAVGIMAAHRTSTLIPLCHPIHVDGLSLDFEVAGGVVDVQAVAEAFERTGLEMEALTACAVAALSIVGELRKFEPRATIGALTLWEKSGGRSGHWQRSPDGSPPETVGSGVRPVA
jgi:cyclic pyranopterin phosphate synthase